MSSTYEALAEQLMSGEIKGESVYKVRNETIQSRIRIRTIPKLKRELRKKSKLLIPLELAFPFNPQTGEADDRYNEANKFRPLMSATTMALTMKHLAAKNEKLKTALMRKARVDSWNLEENLDTLTEEDKRIFRLYRVPRIMTVPVIGVKDPRVTGKEYPVEYTISVQRNQFGQIEGEWPMALKANKFFRELAYEEAEQIKKAVEDAKAGKPYQLDSTALEGMDLSSITEKDLKEVLKEKVYSKIPITEDYPANYLIVYELPLQGDMSLVNPDTYHNLAQQELDKMMRITKRSKEVMTVLEKFLDGTYGKNDRHYDFWEIDMTCPLEYEGQYPERDIPKETRYENPLARLVEEPFYDKLVTVIREHQDSLSDLEERFLTSARLRPFDKAVEAKIMDSIALGTSLENPFITEAVIKSNAEFITEVYGEEGIMLVSSTEAGISDKAAGVLDEAKAADASKINVQEILSETSIDPDEIGSSSTDESVSGDVITLSE